MFKKNYKINLDILIQKIKSTEYNPYDIFNDYCIFLQNNYNLGSLAFRDKIITVKTFLEYNDIEISPRKFKLKVRFPKCKAGRRRRDFRDGVRGRRRPRPDRYSDAGS